MFHMLSLRSTQVCVLPLFLYAQNDLHRWYHYVWLLEMLYVNTELQMYDHVHFCRVQVIRTIFAFLPIGTSVHV